MKIGEILNLEHLFDVVPAAGKPVEFTTVDIRGVLVPYRVGTLNAQTTASGEVIPTMPLHVQNLLKWAETGSLRAGRAGLMAGWREILLDLVHESGLQLKGLTGPVAMSAAVPYGSVLITRDRVILNETWCLERDIDSDGDTITMHLVGDKAVPVKYPLTRSIPVLNRLKLPKGSVLPEHYKPFGQGELREFLENNPAKSPSIEELFMKSHLEVPVAQLTNAWDTHELVTTWKMPREEKIRAFLTNPERAKDIEERGMKAVRKDAGELGSEFFVFNQGVSNRKLAPYLRWYFNPNSIQKVDQSWVRTADLPALMEGILELDDSIIKTESRKAAKKRDNTLPKQYDPSCISRLIKMGLLRVKAMPHKMGTSYLVTLADPKGHTVALTDCKRGNDQFDRGLSWGYILPPVYDLVDYQDLKGNAHKGAGWVNPLVHLEKIISLTVDTQIKNPTTGDISGFFPRRRSEFTDERYRVKVSMLQRAIMGYCGKYGEVCPATLDKHGQPQVTPESEALLSRTIVADYGTDLSAEEMWERVKDIPGVNWAGSKSTARRVRKYVLSNAQGGASWASPRVHLARPGKSRSQLTRGTKIPNWRVAVVDSQTLHQVLICPSGVLKQRRANVFLPKVFNTWAEWEAYRDANDIKAEPKEHLFYTWTGEARKCWVSDPKRAVVIGKLIDALGNKFVPRYVPQYHDQEGNPIDLVIPITELAAKECHHEFLQDAEEITMIYPHPEGERRTQAVTVTHDFYRSGAPSENVPQRYRHVHHRGLAAFAIEHTLSQITGNCKQTRPHMEYPLALQDALRELSSLIPSQDEVSDGGDWE